MACFASSQMSADREFNIVVNIFSCQTEVMAHFLCSHACLRHYVFWVTFPFIHSLHSRMQKSLWFLHIKNPWYQLSYLLHKSLTDSMLQWLKSGEQSSTATVTATLTYKTFGFNFFLEELVNYYNISHKRLTF